jgi:hypothetical protein
MDENTTTTQDEKDLNLEETPNVDQPQKKSKEDNFDGVVRKLNAKEKELKTVSAQLQELQAKISEQETKATATQEETLAKLMTEIEALKTERQQEAFQSRLEKGLDKANIEPKFSKLAKTALQDIAESNDLDLNDSSDLQEAITQLTTDYPEFLAKKQKQIGITDGQGTASNTALSVLEGNAEGYFKLSEAEKKAVLAKAFKK